MTGNLTPAIGIILELSMWDCTDNVRTHMLDPRVPDPPSQWMNASAPAMDRTTSFPERGLDGKILILPRREIDYPHAVRAHRGLPSFTPH